MGGTGIHTPTAVKLYHFSSTILVSTSFVEKSTPVEKKGASAQVCHCQVNEKEARTCFVQGYYGRGVTYGETRTREKKKNRLGWGFFLAFSAKTVFR